MNFGNTVVVVVVDVLFFFFFKDYFIKELNKF